MGTLLQKMPMAQHAKLEIFAIKCGAGDHTFENAGDFTDLLRYVHQEPEIQVTKADATGEKSATADAETATEESTAADAESAAEESSAPKAHTTAKESIAAGAEAAEEESTATDAEAAT
jgi:hypothetical protein